MGSAPSPERDCGLTGVHVCGDNLRTRAFVSALVNARGRQILLFSPPQRPRWLYGDVLQPPRLLFL